MVGKNLLREHFHRFVSRAALRSEARPGSKRRLNVKRRSDCCFGGLWSECSKKLVRLVFEENSIEPTTYR